MNDNIWIISDTHFYHDNIIKYCGRPHNHNDLMWEGLRAVGPGDTLIHGGDVVFTKRQTATACREVFEKLPGVEKILVKGNHDKSKITKQNWSGVAGSLTFDYNGIKFHIQHFSFKKAENIGPGIKRFVRFFMSDWCNLGLTLPEADICIHGHIHNLGRRYLWTGKQLIVNACVEHWDYKPIHIETLVNEYKNRIGSISDIRS